MGKSCLVNQYTNKTYNNNYTPTLGVDAGDKYIESYKGLMHMTIWDFSGKLDFL